MVYYRFDEAFVSIEPSFPLESCDLMVNFRFVDLFDLMVNFRFVGFTLIQYWSCYFLLKAGKIPTTLYTLGFGDLRIRNQTVASLPIYYRNSVHPTQLRKLSIHFQHNSKNNFENKTMHLSTATMKPPATASILHHDMFQFKTIPESCFYSVISNQSPKPLNSIISNHTTKRLHCSFKWSCFVTILSLSKKSVETITQKHKSFFHYPKKNLFISNRNHPSFCDHATLQSQTTTQ